MPRSQEQINASSGALLGEAEKEGKGVAVLNGKFIGPPMVLTAELILSRNKLINSLKK